MRYKVKVAVLKSRQLEFEDLLRKTAELLRKKAQPSHRPAAIAKKRRSAA